MTVRGLRKPGFGRDGPDLLGIYLGDHLAGSTGGLELARRLARSLRDTPDGAALARLEVEVGADRDALREIMRRLRAPERRSKLLAAWTAEKIGRLKANGYLLRRSPLSDVIELEALMLGVRGKAALWQVLLYRARDDPRLDAAELAALVDRAQRQGAELEQLRVRHAAEAFGPATLHTA